jgi:hypothetical protein
MWIFGQKYGRMGRLRRSDWKRLLGSDKFLFKRAASAPPNILGPTMDSQGHVIGDMKMMDRMHFERVASSEQRAFFEELSRVNHRAADEYMLTISGSIEKWREEMSLLVMAAHYLKKEESALDEEERLIREEEKLRASVKLPLVLKRHFPYFFESINLERLNFEAQLAEIKRVRQRVDVEKDYLEQYIKKRRHEMPFLFE